MYILLAGASIRVRRSVAFERQSRDLVAEEGNREVKFEPLATTACSEQLL
jgi:hypothetical protein